MKTGADGRTATASPGPAGGHRVEERGAAAGVELSDRSRTWALSLRLAARDARGQGRTPLVWPTWGSSTQSAHESSRPTRRTIPHERRPGTPASSAARTRSSRCTTSSPRHVAQLESTPSSLADTLRGRRGRRGLVGQSARSSPRTRRSSGPAPDERARRARVADAARRVRRAAR